MTNHKSLESELRFKIHKGKIRTERLLTASWVFIAIVAFVFTWGWL